MEPIRFFAGVVVHERGVSETTEYWPSAADDRVGFAAQRADRSAGGRVIRFGWSEAEFCLAELIARRVRERRLQRLRGVRYLLEQELLTWD